MSKKVKVSKIKIEIGDVEIELTVDQARELRDILGETLGKNVVERVIERDYRPFGWPYTYWSSSSTKANTDGTITYSLSNDQIPNPPPMNEVSLSNAFDDIEWKGN